MLRTVPFIEPRQFLEYLCYNIASIQLADCLRALGDSYQAIAYYDRIAAKDSLHLLAATRKIGLLVQVSRVE